MEECHKMFTDHIDWANPESDQVRIDISKPLPLSGPPGHVTIQTQFFFNKDLDYLRYGSKGSRQALSISKMKAARYHDFGLKLLVLEYMWIDDVCTYDIIASYGISHYVVRINAYSRYRYDYLKEITLRRADHQEYMIAKKDFKNLYPSDFEDLNLLLLQGHLNHLPGFELKHDYTITNSPRTVVFPISNNERKIMRFNEIYMFSDGTLINIMEALDYRVKEYKVNRINPGMNTRFWTDKDVERSRSLQDLEVQVKIEMEIPRSSGVYFITACSYSTNTSNDLMKAQSIEIDRLKQTLSEHLKEKESLMQTVTLLKNDFKKEEPRNIDREIALEKKIKQLDNIVYKRDQSAQTKAQQLEPKLYDGNVIKSTSAIVIPDSEETLMLAEGSHSKMLH
ncbi:hypothetical protein Tco_1105313 [Tanacetum coccineum]